MKKDLEFCFSFLTRALHRKISGPSLCVYVSITVLFWQKVHGALSANIYLFKVRIVTLEYGVKGVHGRCSLKKTLTKRKSIVVVRLLGFNKLCTVFEGFYGCFLKKKSKCPVWYWQYFIAYITFLMQAIAPLQRRSGKATSKKNFFFIGNNRVQ